MRLLGHPVHVMLVHFPVALWPAHLCLQFFAAQLPAGAAAAVGFRILAAGTALGWLAAVAGASDLIALVRSDDPVRLRHGFVHAAVNGSVLAGFTVLAALEYAAYPVIVHGPGFLLTEAVLVAAMIVGNYFGASLIWPNARTKRPGREG